MVNALIFMVVLGIIIYAIANNASNNSRMRWEYEQKVRQEEEALRTAREMILKAELYRQAVTVGDTVTVQRLQDGIYNGPYPEPRDDGAFNSMYDNLRILKIAGINYRSNLSAYVGEFRGILKPEPSNEYDKYAIMVKCEDGKHLGYIHEWQTELVRWMVGAPQPIADEPTLFEPYRITGIIRERCDEIDNHKFYDGCVYIVKK